MEGLDLKLLINIGSVIMAVGSSMIVARVQLKALMEDHEQLVKRVASIANALDKVEVANSANDARVETKLAVISNILSVDNLAKQNREMANIDARLDALRRDVDNHHKEYLSSHNGKHPPVPTSIDYVTHNDGD